MRHRGFLLLADFFRDQEFIMADDTDAYVQLQREIHDALRRQHPEWVEPDGNCPTCQSYELRLAELLGRPLANENRAA